MGTSGRCPPLLVARFEHAGDMLLCSIGISFQVDLGRLFSVFRFVFGSVRDLLFGVANEALGVRTLMFLAPIALFLEFACQLGAALAAFRFRHAVLFTPPARVITDCGGFCIATLMTRMIIARLGLCSLSSWFRTRL